MAWANDPNLIQSLLSSCCSIVGEVDRPDLHLQIAFQFGQKNQFTTDHFLLSVKIPDDPAKGFAVPSITIGKETLYSWRLVGERITDLAAIWFGKRFDYHGVVADSSIAHFPDLSSLSSMMPSNLEPYNSNPRADLGIDLNLVQLVPMLDLLYKRDQEEKLNAFWTAVRFYASSLRLFYSDPEMTFFHLIVALEVISSQVDIPYDLLYDEQTREDIENIKQLVSPEAAKRIRIRMYQIRRKVVYTVTHFLSDKFFEGSKAEKPYKLLPDQIEKRIKAAYDLRSQYAHGGISFGTWFALQEGGPSTEIHLGRPILPGRPKELEILLSNVPTFVGLERIVRFTILSYAHRYLQPIHPALQGNG